MKASTLVSADLPLSNEKRVPYLVSPFKQAGSQDWLDIAYFVFFLISICQYLRYLWLFRLSNTARYLYSPFKQAPFKTTIT